MRISDWSSDVCSSDLIDTEGDILHFVTPEMPEGRTLKGERIAHVKGVAFSGEDDGRPFNLDITRTACTDSMRSEESRVGKECAGRVDPGGRRIIKKKKKENDNNQMTRQK